MLTNTYITELNLVTFPHHIIPDIHKDMVAFCWTTNITQDLKTKLSSLVLFKNITNMNQKLHTKFKDTTLNSNTCSLAQTYKFWFSKSDFAILRCQQQFHPLFNFKCLKWSHLTAAHCESLFTPLVCQSFLICFLFFQLLLLSLFLLNRYPVFPTHKITAAFHTRHTKLINSRATTTSVMHL